MYEEIASTSLAIESLHSFSTECDHRSMLGSCLHGDFSLAQYREIESPLDTEYRLRGRNRDTIMKICLVAIESTLTLRNRECDIEITIAISSFIPFTSDFDCHAIFDAFRNVDRFFDFFSDLTFAMTVRTLLDHSLSGSATR